jgi:deoxyribonuclease-4
MVWPSAKSQAAADPINRPTIVKPFGEKPALANALATGSISGATLLRTSLSIFYHPDVEAIRFFVYLPKVSLGEFVIYLGPAGVPISSEERSTIAGIKCVAELGLNAFECEFVRRVGMSNEMAKEAGKIAAELDIHLSVHCPYFVNLCSQEKEKLEASKKRILDSVERAYFMGAVVAVFHPGFYGSLTREQAYSAVKQSCEDMIERMKSNKVEKVLLGLETMGKQSTFGTLEEIIKISKEVKGCVPVVDWSHLYCRSAGGIKSQEDYARVFDKLEPLKLKHLHCHATSAECTVVGEGKGNEKRHLTIDAKQPDLEPLVKEILRRKINITLISESPILEQDALVLKKMFEKYGYTFKN